jgi:phytoene desaturase
MTTLTPARRSSASSPRSAAGGSPREADVAIIGAGPGGLAAAVLLAASGVRVRVYEAGAIVGGRTARVSAQGPAGTYSFDKGPTFFMMPYVLEEIFASAGESLKDYATLTRLDPMYRLILGRSESEGGTITVDATQDIEEMCRRIGKINAEDGRAFKRFIDDNRYKLRHSESILRNPMRSPLDLFRPGTLVDTLKVGPVLNPHLSVHDLLSRYFKDPHVRLSVSFQSKYLGMSPFECPSLFTILPFIEYEYGIWHPTGGCHGLMLAMARLAEELGVEIVTGAPVEGIEFEPGSTRAGAVRIGGTGPLAGKTVRHDRVVVNADATWAMKNLIPAATRERIGDYSNASLDAKRYSCSTYMIYAGVEGEIDLPHHTIYVSEAYRQNLEDITTNGRLTDDCSVYLCNPSRIDKTLAPAGHSSAYILVPTPNCRESGGKIDWAKDAPVLRERTLDQIKDKMGIDLRGRIRAEVELTPADWERANINFGATFNLAHNLTQMLHWRPQNKLKGFDNVYLVGGGTHPGSGLPTIFLSAQISSRMICEEMGVPFAGSRASVKRISEARAMV